MNVAGLRVVHPRELPAARARVRRFGEETALIVERYDRAGAGNDITRVHQEDLCQALGLPPPAKYESDGGPGCRRMAQAIRVYSTRPGRDLRTFVRALALNWIIGGTDAHAKNFSLLIGAGGKAFLAPLYDVASLLPYPGHYEPRLKLATKIGGEARLGYIQARHWTRLAGEVGRAPQLVRRLCGHEPVSRGQFADRNRFTTTVRRRVCRGRTAWRAVRQAVCLTIGWTRCPSRRRAFGS